MEMLQERVHDLEKSSSKYKEYIKKCKEKEQEKLIKK